MIGRCFGSIAVFVDPVGGRVNCGIISAQVSFFQSRNFGQSRPYVEYQPKLCYHREQRVFVGALWFSPYFVYIGQRGLGLSLESLQLCSPPSSADQEAIF